MRILFLVYHGFSDYSGISKKIHYQVKGLRENGHDVRLCYYGFAINGHRCRYVDDTILSDYGVGAMAGFRQRTDYGCVYDYCIRESIEFVYARCYMNANPWLIRFFKKLRKARIHAVTEIPTYPYDEEFKNFSFKQRMELKIDQLFRDRLYKYMDAMVTFSDSEEIFGQRTIRISNGVDFDSIPLHELVTEHTTSSADIHLIGVAEVHIWHGYDRLIAGIGEYYKNDGKRNVVFHIVGGVHPHERYKANQYHPGMQNIIDKYGIHDKIVFHGTMFGKELDDVFNQCQFAIGSLARHRSGITVIKTLKNREYATRGIPFIYSEQDSDFEHQPYVLKAPADETPIDIQQIIDFVDHFTMKPEEIRKTVEHLSWKVQMEEVIRQVMS
jgi:glycosyltransferase involved in cell wall biosynthesis